ncbi:adenylate/guanylate cyclase domain-containing protein, partial [Streptomyces sp. SID10244]|nr:adenylate/guanylate cyclase domain-containing protein [Streptomyces sp. SID10244]
MARWATAAAALAISITNCVVGVETFLLVQLAFNGGQLNFDTTLGAPNFPAVVIAIVIGLIINVALGLSVFRPQLRWFVSGRPADRARRRAVQRI